ncbi:MAG TPA: PIN domain-containing protein [Acidimicrobiales bacterium]|nr:PIN domain-containing protein [Acidimicrobiales bacterium]
MLVGKEGRAVEVQLLLADRGQHGAPRIPDLMVAATAELAGLIVLHFDKDFELIDGAWERAQLGNRQAEAVASSPRCK